MTTPLIIEAGHGQVSAESLIRLPFAIVGNAPIFPVMSDTIGKIMPAFCEAQSRFKSAKRDTDNPGFTANGKMAKYADLAAVHEACMEALNAQKLSVMHFTVPIGVSEVYLVTRICHASGEWLQSAFPLTTLDSVRQSIADAAKTTALAVPATGGLGSATEDSPGQKKKRAPTVQALGSEITYLRRYCLSALVGVTVEDDDDGNAATAHVQSRPATPAAPRPSGLGR